MNPFIKKCFKDLVPYHAEHITEGVKLDANENAYGLPVLLKEKLMALPVHRYPDTDNSNLVQKLADVYEVMPENVVCGVGSDQLIDCLLRGALEEGDKVLCPDPSFSMYKLSTQINGGSYEPVPLTEDFCYDVESFISAIQTHHPKVTFVCNPNNPTGCILSLKEVERIVVASKGIVVVDEAYMEFAERTTLSAVALVKKYQNLIVFKTFSKAYALAGARIGYGIGSKAVIELINMIKPPYNVNVFSAEAALLVLENRGLFEETIDKLKKQRDALYEGLLNLGIKVYPSHANFLWVESEQDLEKQLKTEAIYIRKMAYKGSNYYRITVGTEGENRALLDALKTHEKEGEE